MSTTSKTCEQKYSFLMCRGNYQNVVRRSLLRRPWWKDMVAEDCPNYKPSSSTLTSAQRKLSNERQDAYANSELEVQNFDFLWKPVSRVRLRAAKSISNKSKTKGHSSVAEIEQIGTIHTIPFPSSRSKLQMLNHLPMHELLTTKPGLCRSLIDYYSKYNNLNPFHTVPETFLVACASSEDPGWLHFATRFKQIATRDYSALDMPSKQCIKNMWIVKPPNSNQGQGIRVFESLSHIKRFVGNEWKKEGNEWVVQKYLERPMLLWGRKFDIRIWVLVTSDFEIMIYKQGYLRTSSSTFTTDKQRNEKDAAFVHLTNYCMQKHSPSVGKYEDGNTLSYDDFQQYINEHLNELGLDVPIDVQVQIMPKIKTMVVDAILAAKNNTTTMKDGIMEGQHPTRKSFELFGYDFMIDEDFRPWLIEVNTNPYLGGQNEWHGELVESMVEDVIRTAVDPLFPPPSGVSINCPQEIEDSKWRQGFEMLWSEKRGYVKIAGCDSPDARSSLGLSWYYAPMSIPSQNGNDWKERRKHLSSRDKNVIKAKERVSKRKKKIKKHSQGNQERELLAKLELKMFRKLKVDQSRAALRSALINADTSMVDEATSLTSPTSTTSPTTSPTTSALKQSLRKKKQSPKHQQSSSSSLSPTSDTSILWRNTIDIDQEAANKAKQNTFKKRQARKQQSIQNGQSSPFSPKSPTSLPKSPILRGRSSTVTGLSSLKLEEEKKLKRRKSSQEYSNKIRTSSINSNAVHSRRSPPSSVTHDHQSSRKSISSASTASRDTLRRDSIRRNTYGNSPSTSPMRSRTSTGRTTKLNASKTSIHLSKSTSSLPFLPQLSSNKDNSSKSNNSSSSNHSNHNNNNHSSSSSTSSIQDYHTLVSSPPRLLSNDALKKKKLEVLSRVKLNCMKQKHDLMTKRKMKLALKLKQQAWVETNLQINNEKINKKSNQIKMLKIKKENERNILIQQEKEKKLIARKEMRKKWLLRQRKKKETEDHKQQLIIEERLMLDTLSMKREADNQMKYEQWRKSKKNERKAKQSQELNLLDSQFSSSSFGTSLGSVYNQHDLYYSTKGYNGNEDFSHPNDVIIHEEDVKNNENETNNYEDLLSISERKSIKRRRNKKRKKREEKYSKK